MGEASVSGSPYEKLTLLKIPPKSSCTADVVADFDKLDLWSNRLDSEYPEDDINYNEGKPKKTHCFHKICKFYGKNKDVFLFISSLRNEDTKALVIRGISERCSNDPKVIEDFTKKMRVHLKRVAKGEIEACTFLDDDELTAFFTGYHSNTSEHPRNIHENLNINVVGQMKTLETSAYFVHTTPYMAYEKSELKKVKIFGNGQRVMNVFKDEDGKRNYVYTKQAVVELEIGWTAKNSKGEELPCVVVLKINDGKVELEKMTVEGEEDTSKMSIPELARQNTSVLVKNKDLHKLLDKLVMNRIKETALEISSAVRSSLLEVNPIDVLSVEKITIQQIPTRAANGEKDILVDFAKLEFSQGPFNPTDELNYNDGIEASPFDKIAKFYNARKDVFLFNSLLLDSEKRTKIFEIVEEKCSSFEDKVVLVGQFKTQMDMYLEKISCGTNDAKEALGDEMEGFFSGCYSTGKKDQSRNIHASLNVSVTKIGQVLKTSNLLISPTPRMKAEKSKLERVKIFGNGKRIMTVVKAENEQRNYWFSKVAEIVLEIRWISLELTTGKDINCSVTLQMKEGQICLKAASIDGVIVKLAQIYAYAQENKEILIKNKSLSKTLEEIFDDGEPVPSLPVSTPTTPTVNAGGTIIDCQSTETLTINLSVKPPDFEQDICEHPDFEEVLWDFEHLEFSRGPFNPDDKLNFCDGEEMNPFHKIRMYYGLYKDIFLFIAVIHDNAHKQKILDIAKHKCGKNTATFLEFERILNEFLDRATLGRKHAIQFLADDYCRGIVGFFAGNHDEHENSVRNIHAFLNISVGMSGKTMKISDYFHRPTPCYEVEKGLLLGVVIYGNGKKLLTVGKMSSGLRNYTYTSFAEMSLEVKWKATDAGNSPSRRNRFRECSVILVIKNDDVSISKATLDGQVVQPAIILELAKQNNKVMFLGKSLYDLVHFSTLKKVIKGYTTLFFTAAQGGDATKLNNKCTDVFLMLMLQDEEEKERILEMVSKKSANPEETRREFLERMDIFKQRFANGEYIIEGGRCYPRNGKKDEYVAAAVAAVKGKGKKGVASGGGVAAGPKAKGAAVGGAKPKKGANGKTVAVDVKPEAVSEEGAAALADDDFVVIDESDLIGVMEGACGGEGVTDFATENRDSNEDSGGGGDESPE